MSVVTGKPVWVLTASKVRRPASSPGPRNDLLEVRFALSKEALNTNGKVNRSANSRSRWAIRSVRSWDSITHGPAIHNSGCPLPQFRPPIETARTECTIPPPWFEFCPASANPRVDPHSQGLGFLDFRETVPFLKRLWSPHDCRQGKFGKIRRTEELAGPGQQSSRHRAEPERVFRPKDR